MRDASKENENSVHGGVGADTPGNERKDFSHCMPPWLKDSVTKQDHKTKETETCIPVCFRENTGGLRFALSDNAGRLILKPGQKFLSEEVRIETGELEQVVLLRDVSMYRTYAYMVTNTAIDTTARVSLRASFVHNISTATINGGQTAVLTPDPNLSYPVFDELVGVAISAVTGTPNLVIRFTGQLEGTLTGLPFAPFAWGDNDFAQLGDSSTGNDRLRPVQTLGLAGVRELSAGSVFSLALLNDGTVWAWGDNIAGQLGDGTLTTHRVPNQIGGLNRIAAVAAGSRFGLAIGSKGNLFAWGSNNSGQIGDGTSGNIRVTPVPVLGVGGSGLLSNVEVIAAGEQHSLAQDAKGRVFAWGSNSDGQLGNNSAPNNSPVPVQVLGVRSSGFLRDIVSLAAGFAHSLALSSDGRVFAWGNNANGQLGNNNAPNDSPVPVRVLGLGGFGFLPGIKAIAAGQSHSLAVSSNGTVFAWGSNAFGQLGNGIVGGESPVPVTVLGPGGVGLLEDIVAVSGGQGHSLALSAEGRVYAWGWNIEGQLGDGTVDQSPTPVLVGTLSDVAGISAGHFHSLAIVR